MPLDVTQTGPGSELTLLRALAEGRRRQSLVARLLLERREDMAVADIRTIREVSKVRHSPPPHSKR